MRKLLPQKEMWLGGRDSNPDTVVQRLGNDATLRAVGISFVHCE
jgi:hypothetical protein